MRLIFAEILGFGRIVNSKVNLDASLIAIVGPNEAGKSTFLKALKSIDNEGNLSSSLFSRSLDPFGDQKLAVKCTYALDDGDLRALEELDLENAPKRIVLSRGLEKGTLKIDFEPALVRSLSKLRGAAETIQNALNTQVFSNVVDESSERFNNKGKTKDPYDKGLSNVKDSIEKAIESSGLEIPKQTIDLAEALRKATLDTTDMGKGIIEALESTIEWSKQSNITGEAKALLRSRIPEFVMFSEPDRSFRPPYALNKELLKNTPTALKNLASAAELNLESLLNYHAAGDESRWRSELHRANMQLRDIFTAAWKQSELTVEFTLNGGNLGIQLIENSHSISVFSERSAGLKMFVALMAFLKARASNRPVILLVDEAETHLHIDAQADLINTFVQQDQAQKIIYTTHSPACLPPDLGTGIRVVTPVEGRDQISEVKGNFWTSSTGFSPLMMAMGASSAAFTPARRVVIAEGASDMILLPSLLRSVLKRDVEYQIAPGLSEASQELIGNLGLEASRVAYLVDGDEGGRELKENLISAGVSTDKIITLGSEGIEEILDVDSYLKMYNDYLTEVLQDFEGFSSAEIEKFKNGDQKVPKAVDKWMVERGFKQPSKVTVATRLVENDLAIAGNPWHQELKRINKEFERVLEVHITS